MMALVADLQRPLVAIEKTPATSAPSFPAPQEEMEIVDLPPEAADDFSSEEEVGDTGCSDHQGDRALRTRVYRHSASAGPYHHDSNLSFVIG